MKNDKNPKLTGGAQAGKAGGRTAFLETAFTSALDGIFVVDRSGRYVDVNPAGCEMFGYTRAEFLSSDISLIVFPEDVDADFENLKKLFDGVRMAGTREKHLRRKDGSGLWVELTVNVFTADGREYALGIKRDITKEKRLKEELLRSREGLEATVAERTVQINEANTALRSIIEGTSSVTGEEFLHSLVRHLATALKFRFALVGEVYGKDRDMIRTRGFWANGRFEDDFDYDLSGTPCENVVGKDMCVYPKNVAGTFPEDTILADIGVQSYVGVPLFDASRAPLGVLVAMDVSPMEDIPYVSSMMAIFGLRAGLELERMRTVDELEKSREMLQAIIDNSTAVIYVKDAQGRYILINRRHEEIFNSSKESLVGKTDYDVFPKEVADSFVENDRKVLEAGMPVEFMERAVHPDGTVHTYLSVKFPMPGLEGAVCGMSTDITDRQKTFERLKEAQHIAGIGSWEWFASTDTTYWSDEMFSILGVEKGSDTSYDAFLSRVHPDDRGMIDSAIREAMKGMKPFNVEVRVVRPDGEERIINDKGEAVLDEFGRLVRMVGTTQDITERKRMETELLKAQKLDSIGVLAGGLAHDFNNLLLGILGNVSMAKSLPGTSEKIPRLLDEVERAALRSKELTKKLLTFSKGGSPVREQASIERLVRDSAGLVLRDTEIDPVFSFPEDLPLVEMDEGQMMQVMNNIILNARHAMPDGGKLSLGAEKVNVGPKDVLPLKEGVYVRTCIQDNGTGMTPDVLSRMFDPFFTTKKNASGLGLALSYSIIKRHNGYISAVSEAGSGTTLCVFLPASAARQRDAVSGAGLEKPVKGKGRVLVMDDEEMVRDVSAEMLDLLGYEAVCATEGEEAVSIFEHARAEGRPFGAVILDLTVPEGMGGLDTMKRLLEIDPDVRAIVSSGYSRDPIMSEYQKHGFASVIAKPYRVAEFSRVVKDVIEGGIKGR